MLRYALICPVVILTGISCSKTWVAPRLDPSANQGDETLRDGSRAPRRDPVPYDRAGELAREQREQMEELRRKVGQARPPASPVPRPVAQPPRPADGDRDPRVQTLKRMVQEGRRKARP